jgi:LacI family transcriptional regulator
MVRDGFEAIARRDSIHIEVDAFDVQPSTPKAEYVRAAKSAQEDGVLGAVLLPSRTGEDETRAEELFLAGCTEAGLPVVLLERGLRNRPLPRNHDLVALDDVGAARHCTEYLLGLGRKKIGLVVASPTSSHNDRVAGYLFALHHAFGLTHPGGHVHVIRQPTEVPSREAFSQVTTQLLTLGCDAVICYQDYLALGVLMELLQRQIPVPEQLAVVGFDNMPFGEAFNLGLTSYKYPAEAMADHAIRLLRDRVAAPDRPAVKLLVPGELIVRASTERD